MQKLNKSKRGEVKIPEGTKIYKYLFENGNHVNYAKWEILEELIKQLPKSRADRADKILSQAIEELSILYPESIGKWPLVKSFICMQILGIEYGETGYEETKKRKLTDEAFEELKKL